MSSTYVIGKRAAVSVDENGVLYYALAEQTYSSNTHPRTPRWSVRYFGTYEQVIRKVIWSSGFVEGGSTGGTAKTPSAYLKQWRDQLASPCRLMTETVSARLGNTLYDLPVSKSDEIAAVMGQFGFDGPTDNSVRISLADNRGHALLAELCNGRIEGVHIQRFLGTGDFGSAAMPELGQQVRVLRRAELPDMSVYKLPLVDSGPNSYFQDQRFLLRYGDRTIHCPYDSAAVRLFLEHVATEEEVKRPGCTEALLAAFRTALDQSPVLPMDVQIEVTREPNGATLHTWQGEAFDAFAAQLGQPGAQAVCASFGEIAKADASQLLYRLEDFQVRYLFKAPVLAGFETEEMFPGFA